MKNVIVEINDIVHVNVGLPGGKNAASTGDDDEDEPESSQLPKISLDE